MQDQLDASLRRFYQAPVFKYSSCNNTNTFDQGDNSINMKPKNGIQGYRKLPHVEDDLDAEETHVKQIKPRKCCSTRSCVLLTVWIVLFVCGVLGLTIFVLQAIYTGKEKGEHHHRYIKYNEFENTTLKETVAPCDDFEITKVWHKTFEKLQTETAVRFIDVNSDGINDPIIAFGTGVDGYHVKREVCDLYFNRTYPCFGGALALDGVTGHELWRHYSGHELYAVNCNGDINEDGVPDCLIGGRGGMFDAVSGKDGKLLWAFWDQHVRSDVMNLYTAQFIKDLNNDGVADVLQIHGGDPLADAYSETRLIGRILIFSGRSGRILRWVETPDKKESYFSPLIYTLKNGTDIVIFGTGGETHGGSLYVIKLTDLYYGKIHNALAIYTDKQKGVMNPPMLIDLTKDGTVDIVSAFFNSTVAAFDGETFKSIWSYSVENSESYSIPAAGFFNEDNTIDFLARFNVGKGFPVYYHSLLMVLDGKSGKPKLKKPYKTSAAANSSPLTISMEGIGNDLFLYWSVDCMGHEGEGGEFDFVKGTNVHEQSRADTCMLRFNKKGFSRLHVMNKKTQFPGTTIYDSTKYHDLEMSQFIEKSNAEVVRHRSSRHIGVPDHGGIQRLISTPGLTDALRSKLDRFARTDSIDVVFPVYWIYPAKTRILTPKDEKCISEYRKNHPGSKGSSDHNTLHDGFYDAGDEAVNFCLKDRAVGKDRFYQSQTTYDARRLLFGTLTVYRFNIKCVCKNLRAGQKCAKMLPMKQQGWAGYMGSFANGFYNVQKKL
eukprot:gene15250-6458_t